jgi:hypothetical protein
MTDIHLVTGDHFRVKKGWHGAGLDDRESEHAYICAETLELPTGPEPKQLLIPKSAIAYILDP